MDEDTEYVVVNAVIFRDDFMWEASVYFEPTDYAQSNQRDLIAVCIQHFEAIIDEALTE